MSKLVTIYGGSGFVGRYIAYRMARAGWRVRVAVRHPNEALFVRTYAWLAKLSRFCATFATTVRCAMRCAVRMRW